MVIVIMIIVSHFVVADMIQLAIFYVLAAAFTSSWQNMAYVCHLLIGQFPIDVLHANATWNV